MDIQGMLCQSAPMLIQKELPGPSLPILFRDYYTHSKSPTNGLSPLQNRGLCFLHSGLLTSFILDPSHAPKSADIVNVILKNFDLIIEKNK